MDHFSQDTWADFARGIGDSKDQLNVRSHVDAGCIGCVAAFDFWKHFYTVGKNENSYRPPEDVVRMLKLEFAARHSELNSSTVAARLIFDTFMRPAPVGVRSIAAAARQMVYEADGLTVDLRFDGLTHSTRVYLTGQALDTRAPRGPLSNAAIILWTERGLPVAETKTNGFGEFNLEFEAQENLRLSIQAVGRSLIRIPLATLKPTSNTDELTHEPLVTRDGLQL